MIFTKFKNMVRLSDCMATVPYSERFIGTIFSALWKLASEIQAILLIYPFIFLLFIMISLIRIEQK